MRKLLLLVLVLAGCESATQATEVDPCSTGVDSTCYHFPTPPGDTLIPLPDSVG